MKEKNFIQIIKNTLNSDYIGDDCANLEDLGIVITQDSLVEDVHFVTKYITPYELGYKSAMVNISDIAASGAKPAYLTVAISLPADCDEKFVEEFYRGMKSGAKEAKIVGGDITGADKIFISITAIGKTQGRKISSRKNAKPGQKVVVSGIHGSSAAGLNELLNAGKRIEDKFTKAHFMPEAQLEFSKKIAETINYDYAMMDTSDGLLDALSTIACESRVKISVDFSKIPYDKDIEKFTDWQNLVLYGGEDYGLVAVLEGKDTSGMIVIGEVKEGCGVEILNGNCCEILSRKDIEKKLYSHFGENHEN
ncbi:thiamine-phosphate kinase [bacterium]|nr:thiamine-phosphate kinase [bacterium]